MSESGQPGAATPGEQGDGTGQQDDLARTDNGWAPPTTGWARGTESPGRLGPRCGGSRRLAPLRGPAGAPRRPGHGDLPAPLPGLPVEEPSGRVNGRHVNGVPQSGEEPPVTRQAPVSAPPLDEPRRDTDGDRLAVPAPRPAPGIEQPQAEAGRSRQASDELPPAGRRWAEQLVRPPRPRPSRCRRSAPPPPASRCRPACMRRPPSPPPRRRTEAGPTRGRVSRPPRRAAPDRAACLSPGRAAGVPPVRAAPGRRAAEPGRALGRR